MRPRDRAQGVSLNSSSNVVSPESNRSQSPPPRSPSKTRAQMVTRRAARRRTSTSGSTHDHQPRNKVLRMNEPEESGKTDRRIAKARIAQRSERRNSNGEAKHAKDLRTLVEEAKERAVASNKYRHAEDVEALYQQALYQESLGNAHLTLLLESYLRKTATPEEAAELKRYIKEKRRSDSTNSSIGNAIPAANVQRERTTKQRPPARQNIMTARDDSEPPTVAKVPAQRQTSTPQNDPAPPVDIPTLLAIFSALALWPRYCLLPPGPDNSSEFRALTITMTNDCGKRKPVHPAPESWVTEMQVQLARVLDNAQPDKQLLILKIMEKPRYKGQDVHVLLTEEVRSAVHHGPFKGRKERGEIGLLLECVGIEMKGSFWKG